jgi:hypothetical protein
MMPAVMRHLRIATLTALGSALLISSCIADRDATGEPETIEASGGRIAAGAGNVVEGGSSGAITEVAAGDGGRETTERGGSSGTNGTSGSGQGGSGSGRGGTGTSAGGAAGEHDLPPGGQAGADASGGVAGEGVPPASGAGHGGSGVDAPPPPLTICLRLPNVTSNATDVAFDYWGATTGDCRISWVSRLYAPDEVQTFLNGLLRWNRALWGCLDSEPPENFGLMFVEVPITPADAEVLIGHYMDSAITRLGMSQNEIDEMRAYIDYLAKRVIEGDSDELSNSTCLEGTGGEGGEP